TANEGPYPASTVEGAAAFLRSMSTLLSTEPTKRYPTRGIVVIHSEPSGGGPRCFLSDAIWTERFVSSTAAPCQAPSMRADLVSPWPGRLRSAVRRRTAR